MDRLEQSGSRMDRYLGRCRHTLGRASYPIPALFESNCRHGMYWKYLQAAALPYAGRSVQRYPLCSLRQEYIPTHRCTGQWSFPVAIQGFAAFESEAIGPCRRNFPRHGFAVRRTFLPMRWSGQPDQKPARLKRLKEKEPASMLCAWTLQASWVCRREPFFLQPRSWITV